MQIRLKRVYDSPASGDGLRVLVDRVWPRGLRRSTARIDLFSRDSFSLVMTDFCMPVMDGFTLAERVRTASPKTPIIMITGSQIREGVDRECVDYIIPKPFQLDEVQRAVEKALTSGKESVIEMNA